MYPDQDSSIPLVVICNTFEAYAEFLNRVEGTDGRDRLFDSIQTTSDRTLLWLGNPKLVVISHAVAHADYLKQRIGYDQTHLAMPMHSTQRLSLDILSDPSLIQQLVEYAGVGQTLQLIPYATTSSFLDLVDVLKTEYQLNIILPESPDRKSVWLRDYVETKMGFRVLISQWLDDANSLLPAGLICTTVEQAADAASWFLSQHQPCIIKANTGFLGIGHLILRPAEASDRQNILAQLRQNPFLQNDLLIVEAYMQTEQSFSPSIEFFVPPLAQGQPTLSHVCQQLFSAPGRYSGELVSREWCHTDWYNRLVHAGSRIAECLQTMGYVGHFDIDAIVDGPERLFLIEINARRTGGTHVHELAEFLLGANYLDHAVLLSESAVDCGPIADCDTLIAQISDLLYPMQNRRSGVIITHSLGLIHHQFGYVIIAPSTPEALALQQRLLDRVQNPQLNNWAALNVGCVR